MAQLKSMMLIVLALMILVIPGILYNNLNANGLNVSQAQALTCSTDPQTPTCQISGNVGCQASSAYCNLSGSSIQFLNINSPFTLLLTGNIFSAFDAAQAGSLYHGAWDTSPGYPYIQAVCAFTATGASRSQTQVLPGKCSQVFSDNKNMTYGQSTSWNNWNTNWNTTVALHFFGIGNATFQTSCHWTSQINFTLLTNGPGWTYYGCDVSQGAHQYPNNPTHRYWSYFVAYPVQDGPFPAGGSGISQQFVSVQLVGWDALECIGVKGPYDSPQCQQWYGQFKGTPLYTNGNTVANFVPSGAAAVLGFFAGIILLVLGLGIGFISGPLGITTNEQGTRLFQTLGLGLVVWTPLYSEFSTWFTTGLLPFGFDGTVGIIAILLTGMFFFGLFWRMLSRD